MVRALCIAAVLAGLLAAPARAAAADPFAGVEQRGMALGSPLAPSTVYFYADLQCPFCRTFERRELPRFVADRVATGAVRLVLRPIAFIGRDSVRAARAVAAAAGQDRAWSLADQLYRRQRGENSGWVTDRLMRRAAAAVPGLDVDRVMRERSRRHATRRLRRAARAADDAHVQGTPTFTLREGERERRLRLGENTAAELEAAIDRRLAPG